MRHLLDACQTSSCINAVRSDVTARLLPSLQCTSFCSTGTDPGIPFSLLQKYLSSFKGSVRYILALMDSRCHYYYYFFLLLKGERCTRSCGAYFGVGAIHWKFAV